MCSRRVLMVLLCMTVVVGLVGLGSEAYAGCTKPPCASVKWYSGSCICCTTGSEVFNFTALGVPGWFVKNCPPGENCVKCSVYGTAQVEGGGTCDPLTLDPDCGISGELFCVNGGGQASNAQGQPFTVEAALFASGSFSNCTKAGKCQGSIQVSGDLSSFECQNANWTPTAFTASEFNGQCCTCDFGYDSSGQCCASADRVADGNGGFACVTLSTETCSDAFHCAVNNIPQPGNMQPYQCCSLSEVNPTTGECP